MVFSYFQLNFIYHITFNFRKYTVFLTNRVICPRVTHAWITALHSSYMRVLRLLLFSTLCYQFFSIGHINATEGPSVSAIMDRLFNNPSLYEHLGHIHINNIYTNVIFVADDDNNKLQVLSLKYTNYHINYIQYASSLILRISLQFTI